MPMPSVDVSNLYKNLTIEGHAKRLQRILVDIESKIRLNIIRGHPSASALTRKTSGVSQRALTLPPSPTRSAPLAPEERETSLNRSLKPQDILNLDDAREQLRKIISDKKLAILFRDFLHSCFNSENFSFWLEVEDFKKLSPDDP